MADQTKQDDILFHNLAQEKKKRRRRTVRVVLITLLVVFGLLVAAVLSLRNMVQEQFSNGDFTVSHFDAIVGSVHSTVNGKGQLEPVDVETVTVPEGVNIDEVLVEVGDTVHAGDTISRIDLSSVMSTMATRQKEIASLDENLSDAASDKVDSSLTAGVPGRVKILYAAAGDLVSDCMLQHGALAVLSTDGYMAVDIPAGALQAGDAVTVRTGEDPETGDFAHSYKATVDSRSGEMATVLLTDDGTIPDEACAVFDGDGNELGRSVMTIHRPLAITGFAGTVSRVRVSENQKVYASTTLFSLSDTAYSANYDRILKERRDKEQELLRLLTLYTDGALLSPSNGCVVSVEYKTDGQSAQNTQSAQSIQSEISMQDLQGLSLSDASVSTETPSSEKLDGTAVLKLTPDREMQLTISVKQTDILSLSPGQEASITISSLSDEPWTGVISALDKGDYTARITLDKADGMLPGMSAEVEIALEGRDNAVLIPKEAVHRNSDGAYVYTSYDSELHEYGGRRTVTTGLEGSDYIEIREGLAEGETVYYENQDIIAFFRGDADDD